MSKSKRLLEAFRSPRGLVLGILGAVTLGVAILSMAVSYQILDPRFGGWAAPTVGALDALWVVFQATEVLAGNNTKRVGRVRGAGLVLTAVNAAIPTADLIMSRASGFDLAMVLTPVAIVATKTAWWIALPSLGRKVSAGTRQNLGDKRQEVADRLEEMEAEAAHRIELLELATELEQQVAEAETAYRVAVLKTQQTMTESLHKQAEATAKTVADKGLPHSVAAIRLPELGQWKPVTPALPGGRDGTVTDNPARHALGTAGVAELEGVTAAGTQVSATSPGQPSRSPASVTDTVTPAVTPGVTAGVTKTQSVTLAQLAAVEGVPVPEVGERLTDVQLGVVLRYLRYQDDPPLSYRQAVTAFRAAGYVGSEERVRRVWGALMSNEETTGASRSGRAGGEASDASEDAGENEEEPEDADA